MNKSFKQTLISCFTVIFVCLLTLVGTSYAWFTDTASTEVNKIQTGNLDVELEYSYDFAEWKKASSTTKLFDDNTLWEPGVTEIVYLRVKNAGNLALKYKIGLNSQVGSSTGINVNGENYKVGDYLKVGTATVTAALSSREEAIEAVKNNVDTLTNTKDLTDMLVLNTGSTSNVVALVIYMPTDTGNEANAGTKASYVYKLGIEVLATQATVESDSYDNTYDYNAPTVFKPISISDGEATVDGNIQANGRSGAVQGELTAKITIDATYVYAVYTYGDGLSAAMAVSAGHRSEIVIKGGDFRQIGVPDDDMCALIYALDNGKITIEGGSFKAAHPAYTLVVLAGSNANITVKGGSFYKYDPSNDPNGENAIFIGDGYKVVQDGDWYNVVPE